MTAIRVLIVDDSRVVRHILQEGLSEDPEIEVVGTAADPYIAREKIAEFRPDVMTLDVDMPRMNGVQFLRHLMPQFPIPTVIISAFTQRGQKTTLDALEAGAVDFVSKPEMNSDYGLEHMISEICEKVKMAAFSDVSIWKGKKEEPSEIPYDTLKPLSKSKKYNNMVIAIGASTGGVTAIRKILTGLPANVPGIVIIQHMLPNFTSTYAERLNEETDFDVKEAEDGDTITSGKVLIAPGGHQVKILGSKGNYYIRCIPCKETDRYCPSVDHMFHSMVKNVASNAIGFVLTGMGNDGAEGLLALRNANGRTFAQDQASSLMSGMPSAAYENGGAEELVPLRTIPKHILHVIKEMVEKRRFTRIEIKGVMLAAAGGVEVQTQIVNLSLGGACVSSTEKLDLGIGDEIQLSFIMTGGLDILTLPAELVIIKGNQYHLKFGIRDLEAFTHLRSLIEANLEDDTEIEKELKYVRRQD